MNAIYDEHKKVYRVNHVDGSFSTYTPEQYRNLFSNPVDSIEETLEKIQYPDDVVPANIHEPITESETLTETEEDTLTQPESGSGVVAEESGVSITTEPNPQV